MTNLVDEAHLLLKHPITVVAIISLLAYNHGVLVPLVKIGGLALGFSVFMLISRQNQLLYIPQPGLFVRKNHVTPKALSGMLYADIRVPVKNGINLILIMRRFDCTKYSSVLASFRNNIQASVHIVGGLNRV